jgi:hypothetical protein
VVNGKPGLLARDEATEKMRVALGCTILALCKKKKKKKKMKPEGNWETRPAALFTCPDTLSSVLQRWLLRRASFSANRH